MKNEEVLKKMVKNEEVLKKLNEMLIGKHGIIMLSEINQPKYVGIMEGVELISSNFLFKFSKSIILFFTSFAMISVIDEQKNNNSCNANSCDVLYIDDKSFMEIIREIIAETS